MQFFIIELLFFKEFFFYYNSGKVGIGIYSRGPVGAWYYGITYPIPTVWAKSLNTPKEKTIF